MVLCAHNLFLLRCLFFADFYNMFAECFRQHSLFFWPFQPLCACFSASWRTCVTWVSVFARRYELRIWMIRKNICRLHPCVSVLTICNCISWKALHESHLSQTATRVFDEPVFWLQFSNQIQNVLIDCVAKFCIFRNRSEISIRFFSPVSRYCGNTVCCAIRRRPNNIRDSKSFYDVLRGYVVNIFVHVDIREGFVPFYTKDFMPPPLESFSNRPCTSEQFQYFHLIKEGL